MITEQIDKLYKQIKKNEDSPNTDYLFGNIKQDNSAEQSIKKLEIMDSLHMRGSVNSIIENNKL